jgi:protein phosphatase 1 regulatory subunit 7
MFKSVDDSETNLDLNAIKIELNHNRIESMAIFSELTKTEFLGLRNNLIKKIEGLQALVSLRELELYDNQINVIQNLETLVNLESVLLSFKP